MRISDWSSDVCSSDLPDTAARRIAALERYEPFWIEEPLAADEPLEVWRKLADSTPIALAAGENIRGQADFAAAANNGHLRFLQHIGRATSRARVCHDV